MTSAQLVVPALLVPFVAWRVYARIRRNIGPQPFQPQRMVVRIAILAAISLALALMVRRSGVALAGLGGGIVLGIPLAYVGVRLTQFEVTAKGTFYTPNVVIGVGLTLLFVGRVAYRALVLLGPGSPDGSPRSTSLFGNPITLLIFGLTAGYYVAYQVGVLTRGRKFESVRSRGA